MLHELSGEFEGDAVVLLLVLPRVAGPQQTVVHALHVRRHLQVEPIVVAERRLLDRSVQDAVDAGARHGDVHALAHSVAAARPAGVQQVHSRAVTVQLLTQQLRVHHGVQWHERASETRREVGHGLLDATLRSSHLRRVAAEEVVHGLLRRQLADGRQHAVGIARQEDDRLRVTRHAVLLVVGDVVDGIRHTSVLRLAHVVEVQRAVVTHHHVLQQRVALDRVPDVRLLLARQVDRLRVAAALEVEDAVVVPAVLVVSDQETLGVRGQRRLARSRQTEEQSAVAVLAHVRRAVHRQNAVQRQLVVHHAENALLHLAAVLRAHHQRQLVLQVEAHERLAVQTLALPVLVHQTLARVDHREVGLEVADLLLRLGTHEHVRHEVVLPRVLRDEAHALAALGVRSAVAVEHVHLLSVHVLLHVVVHLVEHLLRHRLVGGNRTPPDVALARLALHEVLVLGRTTRVDARVHLEGTRLRENSLLVALLMLSNLLYALTNRTEPMYHKTGCGEPWGNSDPPCRDRSQLPWSRCCGQHNHEESGSYA